MIDIMGIIDAPGNIFPGHKKLCRLRVMKNLQIAVVEDEPYAAAYIIAEITKKLHLPVVGTFSSYSAALEGLPRLKPDICTLDWNLGEHDGLELLTELRKTMHKTKWILCTGLNSEIHMRKASRAGLDGIVIKNGKSDELLAAIRSIIDGHKKPYMSPAISHILEKKNLCAHFTETEVKVLTYVARDFDPHEIGPVVHIEYKTVMNHITHIKSKIGIECYPKLIRWAKKLGFGL
jgi:DNA-binding NarL/FixJ family response regulator